MRKKIMTLFITIGLTVSLLACGNDNGNQADPSTDQAFLDSGAVNEEFCPTSIYPEFKTI